MNISHQSIIIFFATTAATIATTTTAQKIDIQPQERRQRGLRNPFNNVPHTDGNENLLVSSTDNFQLTHQPAPDSTGEDGTTTDDGSDDCEKGKTKKIIIRLNRGTGPNAASQRAKGAGLLRAIASKISIDKSYEDENDARATSLLKGIMAAEVDECKVQQLSKSGLFETVDEDHEMKVLGWKDTEYSRGRRRRLFESAPWGIAFTESDQVPGNPANRIKVCVADTGLDLGHEDLPYCARDDQTCKDVVNGTDAYGEEWNWDGHGHGTHCAGTVGAIGGNDKGVIGVFNESYQWSLQVGKALSQTGSGSTSGVMASVEACVEAGAKVVSMSLGCSGESCHSQAADDLFADLYQNHGVLIVAAAGNSGTVNNIRSFPASYPAVVSVAAIDENDNRASFSQVNNQVEIAAPGVGVRSSLPNNNYAAWSGTSMACPHVAAIAAKVWSNFPQCSNWEIRNALGKSAVHPDANGDPLYCDWYRGHGNARAKRMYDLIDSLGCGAGGISKDGDNTALGNMVGGCDQVHETLAPTVSPAPTESFAPSAEPSYPPTNYPTTTHKPSLSPSVTTLPSSSPSDQPSYQPSISQSPSDLPSHSPTYTPTAEARTKLKSGTTNSIQIQHGVMFDTKAKKDITITNFNVTLYTYTPANITIYTKQGTFWPEKDYEAQWQIIGRVEGQTYYGSPHNGDTVILPRYTIEPLFVAAGTVQSFYFKLDDSDNTNRISMDNKGTDLTNRQDVWLENEDMQVFRGIYRSSWQYGSPDNDIKYGFLGAFHYLLSGSNIPTASPTLSAAPTIASTGVENTPTPTSSSQPTGTINILSTPDVGSQSANGFMFDVRGKGSYPARVVSLGLEFQGGSSQQCDFQVYTKMGLTYYAYDKPEQWTMISSGIVAGVGSQLPSFPPQEVNPGETRAFFIALLDCTGTWPISVNSGNNYTGVLVEDDHLAILEGIKFASPLTSSNPFGLPIKPYFSCCAPGYDSHSLRNGYVKYDLVGVTGSPTTTPVPSPSPTTPQYTLSSLQSNYFTSLYGFMFDVEVKVPMILKGFDVMLKNSATNVTINIYHRTGSHVGHDMDSTAWTLIYSTSGVDKMGGTFTSQALENWSHVALSVGHHAFFIDTSSMVSQSIYADMNGADYHEVYAENADMIAFCGLKKHGWATSYAGGRNGWQGAFHYILTGTRFPTTSPTSLPSLSPSFSLAPTMECGDSFCDSNTETCSICPQDCCLEETLSVPEESTTSTYHLGAFTFDLSTGSSYITIQSLVVTLSDAVPVRALMLDEVFSPTKDYLGSAHEQKWTEIATGMSEGNNIPYELVFDTPIVLAPEETRGIALEAVGMSNYFKGKRHQGLEWTQYVNNTNAAISHAFAAPSLFSGQSNGCYDAKDMVISYLVLDGPEQTPAPQPDPTVSPTSQPSNTPSSSPSKSPTIAPVSDAPSKSPTDEPTKSPSVSPSKAPSDPPSVSPSKNPTQAPTSQPTDAPTKAPTPFPTAPPTIAQTVTVTKQLCIKDKDLAGAQICLEGLTSGPCDGLIDGDSCGGGGLKCRFSDCTSGPVTPNPTTSPITPSPTGTENSSAPTPGQGQCVPAGVSCTDSSVNCCSRCSGGKPANRVCQ